MSILLSITTSAVASTGENSTLMSFLPLVAVFFVFYFLIMKPQQNRFKDHQKMIGLVKKGDNVMTAGGIIGKISKIDDVEGLVHLEIADNVIIKISKATIANLYNAKSTINVVKKDKSKKSAVANDN